MASQFREVIQFFDKLGIYDVVLPFLLVFTIVFAILEKTKILGMETFGDTQITRKNLNSMISFVIAFLVVASSELVRTINEAMANMVLLLLLSVSFLILVGSFHTGEEEFGLTGGYRQLFMALMFLGIAFIFLHAIQLKGEPFIYYAWDWVADNLDKYSNVIGSLILLGIVVLFMFLIVREPKEITEQRKKQSKSE